jgi:Cu-Zn family superoxide dismutase
MKIKMQTIIAAAAATVLLAACQTAPQGPLRATAGLKPTQGNKTFGEADFEQVGDRVKVVIFVQGLTPDREHGVHIHEGGDCSGDGTKAGGHFNPFGKPHGRPGTADRHAGDLPSLKANKQGRASITVEVDLISVTPGPGSIICRSVIVHADPDDFRTQPTGNTGARIACGVIAAS